MSKTEVRLVVVAIAVGLFVRAYPIIAGGSVVGDGGLIHSLVDDLRGSGLLLPPATTYNHLDIPFAYPPAALLGAAAVSELFGISTIDLLRWAPMVLSVLTLVAFAWLAGRVVPGLAAAGATLAYALMPSAYGWTVAAGGLTRSTGLLLALLAIALAADRARNGGPTMVRAVAIGVLLGLSGLAHPQAVPFGVVGCMVLSAQRPLGRWFGNVGVSALTAAIVMGPWLIWAASTVGLEPLLAATQRSAPATGLVRLLGLEFSGAPFMDLTGVVGVVGLLAAIWRREARLPLFLLGTYLVGAGGGEFLAAVPWALLGGLGIATLWSIARHLLDGAGPATTRRVGVAVGVVALFLSIVGSAGSVVDSASKLHPLPDDQIAAMAWLAENTPEDAVILVATTEVWGFDETSEWLPALADRQSFGTVQGSEWLGVDGFQRQLDRHHDLLACAGHTVACYATIDPEALIFVPKGQLAGPFSPVDCCPALRETLTSGGYRIIYDEPGATIAAPVGG